MAFQQLYGDLYLWTDICNVYVLKDGDAALLIDLGDGSVLEHLGEIGVKQVDWVLFTHHHREQCQGAGKLAASTKKAAPDAEKALFEQPASFRKLKPTLGDAFSVYGASYVRPPIEPITLDKTFLKMDDFTWRGRELWCVDTRGDSPGGMSYVWKRGDDILAFSGDAMLDGAKLHNWFDAEWDYGFAKGLYALYASAALLERYQPKLLLPSHGPVIKNAAEQFPQFRQKLRELEKHYLRGYELFRFAGGDADRYSKPSAVPHLWQVSKHLYKFKGPDFWPNFELIIADSGQGMVVDCGLIPAALLERTLRLAQERLGLKQIELCVVTHMHGDHCEQAPYLREKWGAKLWTLDRVAPIVEQPLRYDYSAPINTYQKGFESIKFDRLLADGETFHWEGFAFTADWMPGQTEFALCLHGEIDGQRVAFTGDNIFAAPEDPAQNGHEAVVARNSCMVEAGYLYAAEYLHGLGPDLLLGGHSWVMPEPMPLIRRYRETALALRAAYQALSRDEDYRYMFDPYWVRIDPYRLLGKPGQAIDGQLGIRNFRDRPQKHRIEIVAPPGISAAAPVVEGQVAPQQILWLPIRLHLKPDLKPGVYIVALDVTLDGHRYGQWFDAMVGVESA